MQMKARISGQRLEVGLNPPPDDWTHVGNGLRDRIVNRTRRQHVDVEGSAFEPYSEGYKRAKAKKSGRAGGGAVDLTGAGGGLKMLNDIKFKINATTNPRVVLFFNTSDKNTLAVYHNIEGAGKGKVIREFFGLSEADLDWAVNEIRQRMRQRNAGTRTRGSLFG